MIEDYQRILNYNKLENSIVDFLQRSQIASIKQKPEFIAIQSQIEAKRHEVKEIKDRNQKKCGFGKIEILKIRNRKRVVNYNQIIWN